MYFKQRMVLAGFVALFASISFVSADEVLINKIRYKNVRIVNVTGSKIVFKLSYGGITSKPLENVRFIKMDEFPALSRAEQLRVDGKEEQAVEAYKKALKTLKPQRRKWFKKYNKYSDAHENELADIYFEMYKGKWPASLVKYRLEQMQQSTIVSRVAYSRGAKKNKNTCPECNAKKKVRCRFCNGSGNVKCDECNGKWYDICKTCGGKGKTPYQTQEQFYHVRRDRRGRRYRDYYWKTVTKYKPCTDCHRVKLSNGKKVFVDNECSCSKNRHPGYVKCDGCSGSGRVNCETCKGTGIARKKEKPKKVVIEQPDEDIVASNDTEIAEAATKKLSSAKPDKPVDKKPAAVDINKIAPLASPDNLQLVLQHKNAALRHPRELPKWDEMTCLQQEMAEEKYKEDLAKAEKGKVSFKNHDIVWTVCVEDITKDKQRQCYVLIASSEKGNLVTCRFPYKLRSKLGMFKKHNRAEICGKIIDYKFGKENSEVDFFGIKQTGVGATFGVLVEGTDVGLPSEKDSDN